MCPVSCEQIHRVLTEKASCTRIPCCWPDTRWSDVWSTRRCSPLLHVGQPYASAVPPHGTDACPGYRHSLAVRRAPAPLPFRSMRRSQARSLMVIGGMSAVLWRSLEAQSHTGRWWHRHAGRFAASGAPAVVPGAVGSESARMVALSRSVSRLSPCHARCTCISPRHSSRFNMRALMPHCFAAWAMCRRFSCGGSSPSLPSPTRSSQIIHDH